MGVIMAGSTMFALFLGATIWGSGKILSIVGPMVIEEAFAVSPIKGPLDTLLLLAVPLGFILGLTGMVFKLPLAFTIVPSAVALIAYLKLFLGYRHLQNDPTRPVKAG